MSGRDQVQGAALALMVVPEIGVGQLNDAALHLLAERAAPGGGAGVSP